MNKKRIPKLIIIPSEIEGETWRNLKSEEQVQICDKCSSSIFYIKKIWGVIVGELDFGIMGWRSNRKYTIAEIGYVMYCAECGGYHDNLRRFSIEKDSEVILELDDEDDSELSEITNYLNEINRIGKSKKNAFVLYKVKNVVEEYEKKHPINNDMGKPKNKQRRTKKRNAKNRV